MCKQESLGRSAPFEPDTHRVPPHPSRLDFAVNAALEAGHITLRMATQITDASHQLERGDFIVSTLVDAPTGIGRLRDFVRYGSEKDGTLVVYWLIDWPSYRQSVWGEHELRTPSLTEFLALPLPE